MSAAKIITELASRLSRPSAPLLETTRDLIRSNQQLLSEKLSDPPRQVSDSIPPPHMSPPPRSLLSISDIWERLSPSYNLHRCDISNDGQSQPPQVSSSAYFAFLSHLYPSYSNSQQENLAGSAPGRGSESWESGRASAVSNQIRKYTKIDHDELFNAYQNLPKPTPLFLKPNHLKDLLKVFLHRRDFTYGHPMLNATSRSQSPHQIINAYQSTLEKRKKHIERVSTIFKDIRGANLPLGTDERNQLIAMTFFKDKESIIERVENAYAEQRELEERELLEGSNSSSSHRDTRLDSSHLQQLAGGDTGHSPRATSKSGFRYYDHHNSPPVLDWSNYQSILRSFGTDINTETYNVMLNLAIRHNSADVIEDIQQRLLVGAEQEGQVRPVRINRKTVGLLLGHYANTKQPTEFFSLLDRLCTTEEPLIFPDSRTIDAVFAGLLELGEVGPAEQLFDQMYTKSIADSSSRDSSAMIYKNLNYEDTAVYNDILQRYDTLTRLLEKGGKDYQFKLLPTENTIHIFVKHYATKSSAPESQVNNQKIDSLLNLSESKFGVPVTTRMYKLLFQSVQSIDHLQELTMDFLKSYNAAYSNEGLVEKLNSLPLTPNLRSFIERQNIQLQAQQQGAPLPAYLNDRTHHIKLSKDLLLIVYEAYTRCATQVADRSAVSKIEEHRKDLLAKEAARPYAGETTVSTIKEVRYLRKAFLVELLDIGFDIQDHIRDQEQSG